MELEVLEGGDFVDGFWAGYVTVAGAYAIGVAANLWIPVGCLGTTAGGMVGLGCVVNSIV